MRITISDLISMMMMVVVVAMLVGAVRIRGLMCVWRGASPWVSSTGRHL